MDALTNVTRFTFGYDTSGRLTSITDKNGLVTTIEHSGTAPSAIVGPYGQRTTLATDGNGYLRAITNPGGEAYSFTYDENGLMATHVDPRGGLHQFTYDPFGRLTNESRPGGGAWNLVRSEISDRYSVAVSSAMGRTAVHDVTKLASGDRLLTNSNPDGSWSQRSEQAAGRVVSTSSDGTILQTTLSPDPRFGMQAPFAATTVTTPAGMAGSGGQTVSVTLQDPHNPLSVTALTRQVSINGRSSSSTYSATSRSITSTSAGGRVSTAVLDATGRLAQLTASSVLPVSFQYDAAGRLHP